MPSQGQTQVPVSFVIVNGKRIPISNSDPNASGGIPEFDPTEFAKPFDPNEFAQQEPIQNPYYNSPFGPQQYQPQEPTPQEQAPPPPSYYESPFAVKPFQFGDQRPQPEAPDPWYHPDRLIPMALRTGGGVAGGIAGGAAGSFVPGAGTIGGIALGGGVGSYLGDAAAQGYEYLRGDRPEGYDVKSGLVEGGLGAIPFMGKAPGMTAPAKEWFRHAATAPIRGAAEGTFIGGLSPVAHSLVEKHELPSWDEVKTGAKVGAGFGAATAGAFSSVPSIRKGRAANARSAQHVADNALRTSNVDRILSDVDTPNFAATAADLPPIRPKGTIDLPVSNQTNLIVALQKLREATHNASTEELLGQLRMRGHSPETAILEPSNSVERVIADELQSRGVTADAEPPAVPIAKPEQAIEQTPQLEFVDPNTGEIRTGEPQPGDIPLTPDPAQQQAAPELEQPQQRRATKTIGRMELGPSPTEALPVRPEGTEELPVTPTETPAVEGDPDWKWKVTGGPDLPDPGDNFQDWMKNLLKSDEGTSQPIDWSRLRRKAEVEPDSARRERYWAGYARVSDPDRHWIDRMPDEAIQDYIQRNTDNPDFSTSLGQNILAHAQDTLEMRLAGDITFEPQTTPGRDPVNRIRPEAMPTTAGSPEGYVSIANQIRGMTIREADAYIREASDHIYPDDIGPLITELNRRPTASTRTAVHILERQARELESQGIRTNRTEPYEMTQARRVHPDRIDEQLRELIDSLSDEELANYIRENRTRPGNDLAAVNYARDVRDARERVQAHIDASGVPEAGRPRPGYDDPISGEAYADRPHHDEEAGAVQGRGHQLTEDVILERINRDTDARLNEEARRARGEKTLDELEESKRTPAMERLGRMIGEETAQKLVSGEITLDPLNKPVREKGKRLRRGEIQSWGRWAQSEISAAVAGLPNGGIDPSKPGIEVISQGSEYWKDAFNIIWRDKDGIPMGGMISDLDGKAVSILAVNPALGLRRGAVAFEILKEALERGVTKPSGSTSDMTKNLFERGLRLIQRAARDQSGGMSHTEVIHGMMRLVDEFAKSGVAQKAKELGKRFIKDESGTYEPGKAFARLRELFEKGKTGKLTDAEVSEARSLARQAYAPDEPSGGIPSSGAGNTSGAGGAGGVPPSNIPPPGPPNPPGSVPQPPSQPVQGPEPRQPGGVMPQLGPTRRPVQGPVMPGTGRMVNAPQPVTPWDTAAPVPPAQPAGVPRVLGPTQLPRQGPRRPRQPYVDNNPQLVQQLQDRIRKALEQQNPNVGPGDINKMLAEMEQVIRANPNENPVGLIRQVMGANKALLTSWDLSAPGRQGKAFILNKEWWQALPGMVKAWGSKGAADLIHQAIEDHPSGYFKRGVSQNGKPTKSFAEMVGLELSETEEMFRSTGGQAFEKYTGIGKSSRAHTAFLNKLRSDMFANFMDAAKAAGRNPETDLNLARKYAEFINDATGRSKVSGTLRIGKRTLDLNDAFFAPKNMVGQIKTWNNVLNLYRYKQHDPVLRKQALRSLFAVAGVGMMTAEAANQIPGVSVNHDPTSSDFMKIRIGQKRIDLFGGYQQFPVAAMQAILGQKTPTSGKNAGETQDLTKGGFYNRASEAERFFINRLSPAGGFVWAMMRGREFDGKPFEWKRALYERTMPIVVKDLTELAQSDPALAAMISPLLVTGLAGTQVYTGR